MAWPLLTAVVWIRGTSVQVSSCLRELEGHLQQSLNLTGIRSLLVILIQYEDVFKGLKSFYRSCN